MEGVGADSIITSAGSFPKSTSTSTNTLHAHRLDHNPSKLPAYRLTDLKRLPLAIPSALFSPPLPPLPHQIRAQHPPHSVTLPQPESTAPAFATSSKQGTTQDYFSSNTKRPSADNSDTPLSPQRNSISPAGSDPSYHNNPLASPQQQHHGLSRSTILDRRARRAPASHSSNGIETFTGPPPALSTQRSFAAEPTRSSNTSTSEWAQAQQQLAIESLKLPKPQTTTSTDSKGTSRTKDPRSPTRGVSKSLDETKLSSSRPKIPPIRAFRASKARASSGLEMASRTTHRFGSDSEDFDSDRDRTLRALEGGFRAEEPRNDKDRYQRHYEDSRRIEEPQPSTGDLFLDMARDDMTREAHNEGENMDRTERRRSRIALASNRQSLPPGSSTFQQSPIPPMPRRGSDVQASSRQDRPPSRQSNLPSYRPSSRDRQAPASAHPLSSLESSRFAPRHTPTTPRSAGGYRENSFESPPVSHTRRASVQHERATQFPYRSHSYRHSTLSQSRNYNSSPLVPRSMDMDDGPETPRVEEGTSSTASTNAPSTVWDELDNLKSRIHRLELTGKMPPTSGAAVNNATDNRPPTATTTNTTMSTSPKRGRNLSASPIESNGTGPPTNETHPLLHSALAKTKLVLPNEVYSALYSTATDALSIAAMMGSVGTPGPISAAQSVVGSNAGPVTDRQLRRKADSMCRSLTELCLALSEFTPSATPQIGIARPMSRDHSSIGQDSQSPIQQPQHTPNALGDTLGVMKSSPRTLSRLQARRTSLAASSTLPVTQSPRYTPSVNGESTTPTQTNLPGRRTSLFLRTKREDRDDDDQSMYRAPSRAATEVGQIGRAQTLRNSPRDYNRDQPSMLRERGIDRGTVVQSIEKDSDDNRSPSVQSSLPRRRYLSQNASNNSSNSGIPPVPTLNTSAISGLSSPQRRYFERATPDREVGSLAGRMEEARGQRQGSIEYQGRTLPRVGNLNTRRTIAATDSSTAAQAGAYQ